MRAVRCVDGRPTVMDLAAPAGEGVRIKTASAGVCGSDLHMLDLGMLGPYTIGHEFAGWLEDGRPVAVEPLHGCGDCDLCRTGDYNRCPANLADIAGISRDGGMADEVLMWPEAVVPLPAGVDVRDACLVEPIAIAVHGFRMIGLRGDMRVAVIGGGTIGQTALAVARLTGCETAVSARHDAQKEAAERVRAEIEEKKLRTVRVAWGDQHGIVRGKNIITHDFLHVLRNGQDFQTATLFMDTTNNLFAPMFASGGGIGIAELAGGPDSILVPDPTTFRVLPWAPHTGWVLLASDHIYLAATWGDPFVGNILNQNPAAWAQSAVKCRRLQERYGMRIFPGHDNKIIVPDAGESFVLEDVRPFYD